MKSSRICIEFDNQDNLSFKQDLLRQYQVLVHSCIGPINGKLKFVHKKADSKILEIGSSSNCLMNILYRLDLNDQCEQQDQHGFVKWQFDLIKSVILSSHLQRHNDSGLFLVHLINEFICFNDELIRNNKQDNQIETIIDFTDDLLCHLKSDRCLVTLKTDLNSIEFLSNLVRTSLKSKCALGHLSEYEEEDDRDKFVNLCLRALIKSFEDDHFSNIVYLFNENYLLNLNDSKVVDGVLIKLDEFQIETSISSILMSKKQQTQFKCILFDVTFSADFEHLNDLEYKFNIESANFDQHRTVFLQVNRYIKFFNDLIKRFNVDVVLCQKVIHPSIKRYLQECQVIAIDRLSSSLTQPIRELIGCKLCCSSWRLDEINESYFGQLSTIELVEIHSDNYIHLINSLSSVQTFLVCIPNENFTSETQHILKVTQNSFQRVILNGKAFCGGACFYTYCFCYAWRYLLESIKNQVVKKHLAYNLLKKFRSIFILKFAKFLLAHQDLDDYRLNIQCGHLFYKDSNQCECGLFKIEDKSKFSEHVTSLTNENSFYNQKVDVENLLSFDECLTSCLKRNKPFLIDCYESKFNAFKLLKDILSTVSHIGVFIFNK